MPEKFKKSIWLILALFLSGSLIAFIGLTKGLDIASKLSRPFGATSWGISPDMILACTYVPVIMGVALIILSLFFSTVLFMNWIKE